MYFSHPKSRYLRFVKPAYDNFVQPTSRFANIVSFGMLYRCYQDLNPSSRLFPGPTTP